MNWITDHKPLRTLRRHDHPVFSRTDAATGRRFWFFILEDSLFGPYPSLSEAEEELFEHRMAHRAFLQPLPSPWHL